MTKKKMNPNFKSDTKMIHYTSQYNRDDFKSCSRSYYKMKPITKVNQSLAHVVAAKVEKKMICVIKEGIVEVERTIGFCNSTT